MNSLLLSKITKDFLNLDPTLTPARERYRVGWGGSLLAPHEKASALSKEKKKAVALLIALKEKLSSLFTMQPSSVSLSTSLRLPPPLDFPSGTFRPPWYFSRGALEQDRKKNPEPIPYLLTETNETAKARPVPGNSLLLRSLCKGTGILRQNQQGLVYLDVDNRFISMMLPYLKAHGLARPPYFNLFGSPEGAHVPVIPAREISFHYLEQIEHLGQRFAFEVEGLYSMEPISWPEVEQVWFFKLRSEELENLRQRYFLPALPGGHSFHIAVAVKPRVAVADTPHLLPLMRINIALTAA